MGKKSSVVDIIITIVLIFCGLICLIPIINTIAISFSDKTSAALGKVYLLPFNFNLTSYKAIYEEKQFMQSFMVSVVRVIIGGSVNMLITILMAYPLSKGKNVFKFRNIYMWILVFTMIFDGGLIPTFLVVKRLGIMDSIWALVLPGAVPVFNVILLINFFKAIPDSLEEAAYIDGANPWYILWKIFVPLSKAALATLTLFVVVHHWNSFFDGKIYINSPEKLPLQTYIQMLTVDLNPERVQSMTPEEIEKYMAMSNLTFNSAKVVVSMIPVLIIYPFLQRYFVTGIVMGAVKE